MQQHAGFTGTAEVKLAIARHYRAPLGDRAFGLSENLDLCISFGYLMRHLNSHPFVHSDSQLDRLSRILWIPAGPASRLSAALG